MLVSATRLAILVPPLLLAASGCTYDYLARTDRIAYSAGDAVQANLEGQTINPARRTMYVTKGLGKNGPVIPVIGAAVTAPIPAAAATQ